MSRIKAENLCDVLKAKKVDYNIRVTTFIKGSVKNSFLDDCIKRDFNESKTAALVFETYYSIISLYPELKEKEPNAIKQFIIDRIKF